MRGIFFDDIEKGFIPYILKEIYIDKVYDTFLKDKKDLTIIDVGANQGLTTFFFYPYAKQIYSIEPSKQHMNVLNEMVRFNHMGDKVKTIQKAISHENGTATFYHNSNQTAFSLDKKLNDTGETEEVQTIRLDTLFSDYKIKHVDFMKLDVEGSEHEIIGGEGFEKVCKNIDSIVVELHQWSGFNPSQLVNNLRDYGYTVFPIVSQATLFGGIRK